MAKVGTAQWNRATDGLLRPRDRAVLAAQAVRAQLRALGQRQRRRLRLGSRALGSLDLDSLRLPDTRAAHDAEALCAEVSPPFLAEHCHRTYLWGHILADRDGIQFDQELLYVAALLHDLGLTNLCAGQTATNRCFAYWATGPAQDLCDRAGWNSERRERVANAISLHLNPDVSLKHGAEAHLLGAGAGCDVAGIRASQIERATRQAVVERHPRSDFKRAMPALLRERANHPGTRANFLITAGQIEKRIAAAPFGD